MTHLVVSGECLALFPAETITASDAGLLIDFPRSLLQEEVCLLERYSAGFSAAGRNSMGSTRALLRLTPLHSMDGGSCPSPGAVGRVTPIGHPSRPAPSRSPLPKFAAMKCTEGLWVSWSRRHKSMNFMEMVGPPGLEPGTKGN